MCDRRFVEPRPELLTMANGREADRNKTKFSNMANFPKVFACIDGTQIPIQAPRQQEHEYINRKNFHSVNVQVNCEIIYVLLYNVPCANVTIIQCTCHVYLVCVDLDLYITCVCRSRSIHYMCVFVCNCLCVCAIGC